MRMHTCTHTRNHVHAHRHDACLPDPFVPAAARPRATAAPPPCRFAPRCALQESALFNATAQAMAECASASESLEACEAAGVGTTAVDLDRFSDAPELIFIEQLGAAAPLSRRPPLLLLLLAAALAAAAAAVLAAPAQMP
jgi:hypothetical protein